MRRCSIVILLAVALCAPVVADSTTETAVPVRTVPPEYPDVLRKEGVEGIVVIGFTVDEQGNVVDPQVQKSTRSEFEQPALQAVKRWKFKPARQNGAPVARKVSVPIHFAVEK